MSGPRPSRDVLIVPTGSANIASVLTALARLGCRTRLAESAAEIDAAERVVLPGVGAFGAAMAQLDRLGFTTTLRERLAAGRPTLGVCLGMQLLARESEESPGVAGLGIVPARIERFTDEHGSTEPRGDELGGGEPRLRVPHMGWNRVEFEGDAFPGGAAYFANSFRLRSAPDGWTAAFSDHGGRFVAAMARAGVLACQFHPELSGRWGLELLDRWLTAPESISAETPSRREASRC